MSLRYALVGLLAEESMSGYDLTKRFAVSLANVWPAQHSSIYTELARLMELGWIRQTGAGPRGRKVYAATAEGLTALRNWLEYTESDRTLRHEPILRAFFRWTLDPGVAAEQFRADADAYAAASRELGDLAKSLDWASTPADRSGRLALEAGLRLYRVLSDWATWAADQLDAPPASPPASGPGIEAFPGMRQR